MDEWMVPFCGKSGLLLGITEQSLQRSSLRKIKIDCFCLLL